MTEAERLERSLIEQIEAIQNEARTQIEPLVQRLSQLRALQPLGPLYVCLACNHIVMPNEPCLHCVTRRVTDA